MNNHVFEAEYGPYRLRYSFINSGTRFYFRNYLCPVDGDQFDIRITPELMEIGRSELPEDSTDSYVEYRVMTSETARALLQFGCCILHSVAFVYRGFSWLLAAPSGVGKTTQYLNWIRLHPGETEMICGDMPVISPESNGKINIYSTSWCGKESFGNKSLTAPLAGIVLLQQGKENQLMQMSPEDCIIPLIHQFVLIPDNEQQCYAIAELLDKLLKIIPVFSFLNIGDDSSTEMIRDAFNKRIEYLDGGMNDSI